MIRSNRRTFWGTPLLVAALLALVGGGQLARADAFNRVRAVTFVEEGGTTRVRIDGSQVATFTVYKLERPSRVVLDLARAELAEELRGPEVGATLSANTWSVGTVSAQPLRDGGNGVRVIIALARPGRYDVKVDGDDLVVVVTARDPAPAVVSGADAAKAKALAESAQRESAAARAEAARLRGENDRVARVAQEAELEQVRTRAQLDSVEKARQDAEAAKEAAEVARRNAEREVVASKDSAAALASEAKRLRAAAAESAARAERAEKVAAAAAARDSSRNAAERAEAARAKAEADSARRQAESARVTALAAQEEAAVAKGAAAAAAAEVTRARAESERTRVEAERLRAAAVDAKRLAEQELERSRKELAQAKDQAAKELAQAKDQVAKERAAVEVERREVTKREAALAAETARARSETAKVRGEAEASQRAAAAAKVEAEKLASDAKATLTAAQQKLADANAKVGEANARLAELDRQSEQARTLRESASRTQAQAAARESAAAAALEQANAARRAAQAEVARLTAARDQASSQTRAEREQLAAEAKAAQERLAEVTRAVASAEAQRTAAERAASAAATELERKKNALVFVENQRQDSEQRLREAAARQSAAESAARAATERRHKAESDAQSAETLRLAAQAAAQKAETQRLAAERAARSAESQRAAAEAASRAAATERTAAEAGLAELAERRRSAERAAAQLVAQRTAAEAASRAADEAAQKRASAETQRQAQEAAQTLAAAQKAAEADLAARRAAVTAQAKEVERLEAQAARARAASEREEAHLTALAARRSAEERELARLRERAAASQAQAAAATPKDAGPSLVSARPAVAAAAPVAAPVAAAPAKPKTAPASAAAALGEISDIRFHGDEAEPRIEVFVPAGAKVAARDAGDHRAALVIDGAALPTALERKLDVSRYGGAIRSISSYRDRKVAGRVHVVVDLSTAATGAIDRKADVVGWRFASKAVARRPRTQNLPPTVIGGYGAASTPVAQQSVTQVNPAARRRKVYRGPTVEMDFKDAPIHDLLRLLSDVGKVNIVVPDEVDAKVTVRMKRVPWDQALEVILASKGLWYRQEGNLIRVAQRKQLDEEDEAEAARRAAAVRAEAPRPDVLTLNYASAENLRNKLQPLLSPKGKIEVDDRTNALIVNDVRANREEVRALALQLDTQTPQISIEARIVEARSSYNREIGVQWGGRAVAGPEGGNATGLLFPSSIGLTGGAEDATTVRSGVPAPSDFAVNLPAAVGSGAGGALGLSLGSIGGNYNINLRLSALEGTGSVRIISAPKITVLNNTEARISQGVSVPIQVLSAQGTNTVFVPADLSLTVKPYVSLRDCAIAMDLTVTKNEPDFVNTGARGDPTILRKEARTTLLVNDGETSVLGGIYTRNAGLSYSKVPFFGDLPVLGWFFKNRKENDSRTEVLVFITPKITNKAFLRCQGPGQ